MEQMHKISRTQINNLINYLTNSRLPYIDVVAFAQMLSKLEEIKPLPAESEKEAKPTE